MKVYQVTVKRELTVIVGNSPSSDSARQFAADLVDSSQVGDGDWDQTITVNPYEPADGAP